MYREVVRGGAKHIFKTGQNADIGLSHVLPSASSVWTEVSHGRGRDTSGRMLRVACVS